MRGSVLETQCCGSPGYMAPEVINKGGYGTKADIYSIGLILYYMYLIIFKLFRLTGEPAFKGDSVEEILQNNKAGDIDIIGEKWDKVGMDAKDLLMRMIVKDQYQRISAKECLEHPYLCKTMTASGLHPLVFLVKDKEKVKGPTEKE